MVSNDFDPTIREALEIILEKYEMNLDDKLSSLCANQDAMRGIIGTLSIALKDQEGIDWSKFVEK
jgi:hypothetical protein